MSLYYEAAPFLLLTSSSSTSKSSSSGFGNQTVIPTSAQIQKHLSTLSSRVYGTSAITSSTTAAAAATTATAAKNKNGTVPKTLKTKPAHIYALVSETTKWLPVLSDIIDRSGLLIHEKKKITSRELALLLAHDHLISKQGISAPRGHPLRQAVERNKARLRAEFTQARVRAGFTSVEAWRTHLASSLVLNGNSYSHGGNYDASETASLEKRNPVRWLRVNTLRGATTSRELDSLSGGVFAEYEQTDKLADIIQCQLQLYFHLHHPSSHSEDQRGTNVNLSQQQDDEKQERQPVRTLKRKIMFLDRHVSDLIAVPQAYTSELVRTSAYKHGRIIIQDKASCFPALLLLSPTAKAADEQEGDVIDACAAPGNKTTHLAALLKSSDRTGSTRANLENSDGRMRRNKQAKVKRKIYACERDAGRSATLKSMVEKAGASDLVECLARQDFTDLNPQDERFANVTAILLDPSCSGSGMLGRSSDAVEDEGTDMDDHDAKAVEREDKQAHRNTLEIAKNQIQQQKHKQRLTALSNFQLTLLKHAFAFPRAKRIVYSTCSIHAEENEHVVVRALASGIARQRGWRILPRYDARAAPGLQQWKVRGVPAAVMEEQMRQQPPAAKSVANGSNTASVGVQSNSIGLASAHEVAEACIRCNRYEYKPALRFSGSNTSLAGGECQNGDANAAAEQGRGQVEKEKEEEEATMGFFVAAFVRDSDDDYGGDVDVDSNLYATAAAVVAAGAEVEAAAAGARAGRMLVDSANGDSSEGGEEEKEEDDDKDDDYNAIEKEEEWCGFDDDC